MGYPPLADVLRTTSLLLLAGGPYPPFAPPGSVTSMLCPALIRTVLPEVDSVRTTRDDERVAAVVGCVAVAEAPVVGVTKAAGVSAGALLGEALVRRVEVEVGEVPQAAPTINNGKVTSAIGRGLMCLGRGGSRRGSSLSQRPGGCRAA